MTVSEPEKKHVDSDEADQHPDLIPISVPG